MAYGDFKVLPTRRASDKVLHDKAFNIAKNLKYDDVIGVLFQWFIIYLRKRCHVVVLKIRIRQTNI